MACPPAGVGLGSAEKLCSLRGEESAALISKPQPDSPQTSRGGSETARRQGTLVLSFCPLLPSPFPLFLPSFLHVFLAGIFSSITSLIYYYFLSKRKTPHRKAGSHPETPPGCVLIPPRPTSTSLSYFKEPLFRNTHRKAGSLETCFVTKEPTQGKRKWNYYTLRVGTGDKGTYT